MQIPETLAAFLINTVEEASQAAMKIYRGNEFGIQYKSDKSPVTNADLEVNRILTDALKIRTPEIPIISEEAKVPFEMRQQYDKYWIIDPIDGTLEFINKTDEFTINLALIEKGKPIFGIISIPCSNEIFFGGQEVEASFIDGLGDFPVFKKDFAKGSYVRRYLDGKITTSPIFARKLNLISPIGQIIDVTCSRNHRHANDQKFIENISQSYYIKLKPCGSTIKMCHIAEGKADLYIRMKGVYDWDLAAGQAIVEAAGGHVTTPNDCELTYNTSNQRLEPFIVYGKTKLKWSDWC